MLSIVCPFYDERENLQELVSRLLKAGEKIHIPWEAVFVDDGSKDGGPEELQKLIAESPSMRLIRLEENRGLTSALYAGLQAAMGDLIATLDADLQNPPEEIPRLLFMMEDYDMITGYRAERNDKFVKRASSKIANNIRRAVIGDRIKDVGCSLRIFKKSVLETFYPYKGMHRFFPAIAERAGFKIKQVPVEHSPRKAGKAKYHLFNRLLGPLWDLIAVSWLLKNKINYRIKS